VGLTLSLRLSNSELAKAQLQIATAEGKRDGILTVRIYAHSYETKAEQISQIVSLKTALEVMRYAYVIARNNGVDIVPECERQTAIAELNQISYGGF
jgi:hypothetical protein